MGCFWLSEVKKTGRGMGIAERSVGRAVWKNGFGIRPSGSCPGQRAGHTKGVTKSKDAGAGIERIGRR